MADHKDDLMSPEQQAHIAKNAAYAAETDAMLKKAGERISENLEALAKRPANERTLKVRQAGIKALASYDRYLPNANDPVSPDMTLARQEVAGGLKPGRQGRPLVTPEDTKPAMGEWTKKAGDQTVDVTGTTDKRTR